MENQGRIHWIPIANAVLVGWNIGVLAAFLVAIGILAIFQSFESPWALVPLAAISLGTGGFLGYVSARRLLPWFSRFIAAVGGVWLVALLTVTWLAFPLPFVYTIGI